MELLRSSRSTDSLGSFYQAATEALGFIPADGEYKTMGLAALGKPHIEPNPFEGIVSVHDGVLHSKVQWEFRDYNKHHPDQPVPNPLSSVSYSEELKKLLDTMYLNQFGFIAPDNFKKNILDFA